MTVLSNCVWKTFDGVWLYCKIYSNKELINAIRTVKTGKDTLNECNLKYTWATLEAWWSYLKAATLDMHLLGASSIVWKHSNHSNICGVSLLKILINRHKGFTVPDNTSRDNMKEQ